MSTFLKTRLDSMDKLFGKPNLLPHHTMTLKLILNEVKQKDLPEYKDLINLLDKNNAEYVIKMYTDFVIVLLRKLYAKTECKYLDICLNSVPVI